ncbi:siroheme synthase CysG [Marinicella sp. S1101]|uniref:siroheme synthase CysG n=1 Tax=Marinicella marina TaxID=2996016 RepID=UPI0022609F1A|nr:siroheme synthase CysG [Marinicella marina]MCX7555169.1 siroheme synthase CysG [Marinicella marina]MDJ1139995.1 siroheme synthase CysG [Marinicella marina]
MQYLPINIDIKNKPTLVLGGGSVAYRKIKMLLKAGTQITCISLSFEPPIETLAQQQKLHLIRADLLAESVHYLTALYLSDFRLIISATDNDEIGARVFQIGEENQILVNTVDEKKWCNYITPAMVDRDPIMVAISSAGSAPVLARNIREKIEQVLPKNLGRLAEKAQSLRHKVNQLPLSFTLKKRFWERFFSSSHATDLINSRAVPDDDKLIDDIHNQVDKGGEVLLVGAGPGDPELLTIKALRAIQEADIVLHDRLVSNDILELIRRDAEIISVGKTQGFHSVPQDEINSLLVKYALQGNKVVRLKGGDPFVFGRGGEELAQCQSAGVKFSIIPGITAAVGCAAYAGIPLTHRDHAQNVLFVTAHCKNSIDVLDWPALARKRQTLAVYMGLMKSAVLSKELINHGRKACTPVAIIENGTTQQQRVIRGQLSQLTELINKHKVKSPALIIIGEVAALNENLAWFINDHPKITTTNQLKIA